VEPQQKPRPSQFIVMIDRHHWTVYFVSASNLKTEPINSLVVLRFLSSTSYHNESYSE